MKLLMHNKWENNSVNKNQKEFKNLINFKSKQFKLPKIITQIH